MIEWLLSILEPLLKGVLIPLGLFLSALGSTLGLSNQQTDGKWVYLTDTQVEGVAGTACSPHVGAKLCLGVPGENTAVIYPVIWQPRDYSLIGHVVRHEVEHLLRAEGSVPGSTYNEKEVAEVACRDAHHPLYCGERE